MMIINTFFSVITTTSIIMIVANALTGIIIIFATITMPRFLVLVYVLLFFIPTATVYSTTPDIGTSLRFQRKNPKSDVSPL